MTDLTDLLRPLVDRAPYPPSVGELEARVSRRRRRRRAGVAAMVAVIAAVVAVTADAAVGSGRHVTRVQIGQFPGGLAQPASVALPGGYVFNSISATATGLLIAGGVPSAGAEQCVYASVNESSLQVGAVHEANCDDPVVGGHTVSVVTGSAGMGSENTARIATVDPATSRVSLGPTVFTYLVGSDTGVESAYGGGWMWVYEVGTSHGPEVLQVDTTTGRVVDTIPAPAIYDPILAANDAGLWIGTSAYGVQQQTDTLYRVAPGSHAAVTVVTGRRVVNWLQAGPTHLWAGIATAEYLSHGVFSGTLSDETIWRFNGSDTRAAYAVSLGGFNYDSVVGDESDWLWTERWPASASRVSPSPEPSQIVRINPDTGAQTVLVTLPPVLEPNATQGFSIGQATVIDGNLYILEPPQRLGTTIGQYAALTRVAAPTGTSPASNSSAAAGPARLPPFLGGGPTTGRSWRHGLLSLAPPSHRQAPQLSAEAVYQDSQSGCASTLSGSSLEPVIEYGDYTDLDYGTVQPNGNIKPFFDAKLVWLCMYLGVPAGDIHLKGGGLAPDANRGSATQTTALVGTALGDVIVVVDPQTGRELDLRTEPATDRDTTFIPSAN